MLNPFEEVAKISEKERLRVVGMMTGTSFDGIDVAIVDVSGSCPDLKYEIVSLHYHRYPDDLRSKIWDFLENPTVEKLASLDVPIAREHVMAFYEALHKHEIPISSVDLVSIHGQTVWHSPRMMSIQLGNPDLVSLGCGKIVVSDFRSKDIALGGEGAPITPYVDHCIFSKKAPILLQNIGGIGNLTLVTENIFDVLAFDTGPGNALTDIVAKKYFGVDYDEGGKIAKIGKVHEEMALKVLKSDDFVRKFPPKSTGKEYYNEDFLRRFRIDDPADLMATVTYYTALTISESIKMFVLEKADVDRMYVSGGGAKNDTLLEFVEQLSGLRVVRFSETFSDFKEAICFAILGYEFVRGKGTNIPSVTGASRMVSLGRISTYW